VLGCPCAMNATGADAAPATAVRPWYTYVAVGAVAGGLTGVVFPDPFTRFFDFKKKESFDRISVTLASVGGAIGLLVWLKNRGSGA